MFIHIAKKTGLTKPTVEFARSGTNAPRYKARLLSYCFIFFVVALASLITLSAHGISRDRLPNAELQNQVFDSELSAVVHAMNTYNPISVRQDREYIGAIYKLHRRNAYLYSVAPGSSGKDQVSANIPKIANAEIVSFWHTHGNHHHTRYYFSHLDTHLVEKFQLPFYLGCADGQLRVFEPGDKLLSLRQAQLLGLGRESGYAKGRIIKNLKINS